MDKKYIYLISFTYNTYKYYYYYVTIIINNYCSSLLHQNSSLPTPYIYIYIAKHVMIY